MQRLFKQFSFPGGIPSHVAPETPGSIHEGGELGYSLSHAYGAAFDNPDLLVCCVVGDGEAETGPLATSWHSNKFLNPGTRRRGAADPASERLQDRQPHRAGAHSRRGTEQPARRLRLQALFRGGRRPADHAQQMAATLDTVVDEIQAIQTEARSAGRYGAPAWPMIVLRTPKGWTGPKTVDGKKTEGTWRSHQVPIADMSKPEHVALLEEWMRSYKPEELFDADGRLHPGTGGAGARRASGAWARTPTPTAACCCSDLRLPDFRDYAVAVHQTRQRPSAEATRVLGEFLRDVMKQNADGRNFRIFGPDENNSNRLDAILERDGPRLDAETLPEDDEHLSPTAASWRS